MKKKLKLLFVIFNILSSLEARAQSPKSSSDDAKALLCGRLQIEANQCLKKQKELGKSVFGGIAAKVTSSDLGKTAADKSSEQSANFLCKDKLEKALKACDGE